MIVAVVILIYYSLVCSGIQWRHVFMSREKLKKLHKPLLQDIPPHIYPCPQIISLLQVTSKDNRHVSLATFEQDSRFNIPKTSLIPERLLEDIKYADRAVILSTLKYSYQWQWELWHHLAAKETPTFHTLKQFN